MVMIIIGLVNRLRHRCSILVIQSTCYIQLYMYEFSRIYCNNLNDRGRNYLPNIKLKQNVAINKCIPSPSVCRTPQTSQRCTSRRNRSAALSELPQSLFSPSRTLSCIARTSVCTRRSWRRFAAGVCPIS